MRTRLLLLAAIAVPLIAAGALLTRAVVGGERERQQAEILRLALWRLDARASNLLLAEASRAPEAYRSFWSPAEAFGERLAPAGRVRLPSPLLLLPEAPVWLHLRQHGGRIDSPQVPEGLERRLALDGLVLAEELAEAERRLGELRRLLAMASPSLADLPQLRAPGDFRALPAEEAAPAAMAPTAEVAMGQKERAEDEPRQEAQAPVIAPAQVAVREELQQPSPQQGLANNDFLSRAQNVAEVQRSAQSTIDNGGISSSWSSRASKVRSKAPVAEAKAPQPAIPVPRPLATPSDVVAGLPTNPPAVSTARARQQSDPRPVVPVAPAPSSSPQGAATSPLPPAAAGLLEARWLGERFLLLARRARVDGREEMQMAVVDWPALQRQLLEPLADLLPAARLLPQRAGDGEATRLAALPLRLHPGAVALPPLDPAARWTIAIAWGALLAGLAGAAGLLIAAQRLAERRAAFVSAVTHELRTPLTALRLHADLLADPRVDGDEDRRRQRVGIVRAEAGRLAHLIDNVLDYARLERRRPPQARSVPLSDLLVPIVPRLRERLAAAGLGLEAGEPPASLVACDPAAVERILLNLADNAAKYAAAGTQPVTLRILVGRQLELRLRDRGPGLAADVRQRLFAPFARSAEAAAGNAPGVGLGLALCRRLARAQGGDLRLEEPADGGVEAVLELPLG